MSTLQAPIAQNPVITPPLSFADHPLTPPPTDEKQSAQVHRVIALFERSGREGTSSDTQMGRYDYDEESDRLVVRMPTAVHELFITRVEDAIFSQLKSISDGLGAAAAFAQKVYPARSTEIYFPVDSVSSGRKSKHEPDASFWHNDAQYPGVVIEVAYS
ncbi:uncharacterized protein BDZ99DRAFT_525631 [Mytilinidion resinicola]|uniref:Uncharacterized protein n=1 Tax=Mytilinidion resinicola TaxID=574789 RepID=A0A6A6Y7B5_9PEZI|nr:uncharacterized protein BDZ99DRAFT_525631 [Mytilinidion resinicola]KAF2804423.1 hypothetical protein BDZ99DRAFT_525631 [Mytilinidion resinicola]